MRLLLPSLAVLLSATACNLPVREQSIPYSPYGWGTAAGETEAPLYGRDGAPVGRGNSSALPRVPDDPTLGIQQPAEGGSRTTILELYNRTKDESEQLREELDFAEREIEALYTDRDSLLAQIEQLQARLTASEEARAASEVRTFEIAERLATAQLRRLEAEKRLLELSLQQVPSR